MANKITKRAYDGRILKDRGRPVGSDPNREWRYHATKGWTSRRKSS